ncbi:MAG: pirin family protein [Planctomycetes bacterium]|nr:pirin family protein [Planctomycetota bacterium]
MITLRKADQRGHADHGWLDTHHTFSFAGYQDPNHMGFRALRVINEDRVQPGQGFGKHGHRDMEILSIVLEGELAHEDSLGNGSVIRPGDVQRMSAGKGILHSEFNHSQSERVHFLQIWIEPAEKGIDPGYEQVHFPVEERTNQLRLVASRDGREGSLTVHQDASVYASLLEAGESLSYSLPAGRHAWVQVARGELTLNGQTLRAGDGARTSDPGELTLSASADAELLLFDLA